MGFVCSSTEACSIRLVIGCVQDRFVLYKYSLSNAWHIGSIAPASSHTTPHREYPTDEAYLANTRHIIQKVFNYGDCPPVHQIALKSASVPVAVTKLLETQSIPFDPFSIVAENPAGFVVRFDSLHAKYLLYVRSSYAKLVLSRQPPIVQTLTLDTLALALAPDFLHGTLQHYHTRIVSRVLFRFAQRSDAHKIFGMHLHIEPIGESMFPDPTLVLQWLRGPVSFHVDPLTLKVIIDKQPFWHIVLHVLPGQDKELDRCYEYCDHIRQLHGALDELLSSD